MHCDDYAEGGHSTPSPLFVGVAIEDCVKCGAAATPDELAGRLCIECRSHEFSESLCPLEGYDGLGLAQCDDEFIRSLRVAACRSVALDLDQSPFDVSALSDRLTLRATEFA